jgi:hypothetical protein
MKTCIRCNLAVALLAAWGAFVFMDQADAGIMYGDPAGGWSYLYTGDEVSGTDGEALDGTWDHENGSDEWDGSMIGEDDTAPGGVSSITEGEVTFARFQDTGDPRNDGFEDPSNRKIYVTHDIEDDDPDGDLLTSGVTLTFRTRLSTTGLLDGDWPETGDGYYVLDNGKANFGIRQPSDPALISFALATADGDDLAENETGALLMNNFDESGNGDNVDTTESGEHREFAVSDPTAWNEFWITIQGTEEINQFKVDVYANGSNTAESFIVTGGTGSDSVSQSYIAMGVHSTGQSGAFDVDFFGYKPGVIPPVSGVLTGDFDSNGALDVADIDALAAAIRNNSTDAKFDVNGDGSVNAADHTTWVKGLKHTWIGDADLDGLFNSSDFVAVFQAGKFETAQPASWGEGDWNGDNQFGSSDFVAAFQDGGYEKGPLPATASVPEPATACLFGLGVFILFYRGRK